MSLSDLPDDILNLISFWLNGFDNCFLWMASDSKLKQRLVYNVITDFDIKYTTPGRYLWPGNFLKKLQRLSRLSLVVAADVYHLPIENVELFPIPTLKYLKISFSDYRVFRQTQLRSIDDQYINLNDYYSNLEYLEIINCAGADRLSIEFLASLPQKLNILHVPHLEMENPTYNLNASVGMLPQSLTILDIWFDYQYDNKPLLDCSKLPSNLTSLTTNILLDDQTYHMIPKSLKKLKLFSHEYMVETLATHLPTELECLSLMIDECPSMTQIFEHLQNLRVLYIQCQESLQFEYPFTSRLPKLQKFSWSELLDMSNIPVTKSIFNNCLTKLELNDAAGITPEFISMLPQSLTHLSMSEYDHHIQPFAFFSLLPRNLKYLDTNLTIIENTSLLPESLTSLDCSDTSPTDASYFDAFPPKLKTLTMKQKIPTSILKGLPSGLTALSVSCNEVVDDEIVRMLPRGLKAFLLESPDNITNAGVADLPPHLENLNLKKNKTITDDAIERLPRNLMHLSLPLNPNFTDACVRHLPRKLITLHLSQTTRITSKSCKELPKYLAVMYLQKCENWNSAELIAAKDELPQHIQYPNLGNQEANNTWRNLKMIY